MSSPVSRWMSWEGGVDLVAVTTPGLAMPNVIVHVARLVHTPVGSAPSGMVFFQPDATQAPQVMGFVSTNPKVGAYFGANIFAGTPFEAAPALAATIEIDTSSAGFVSATVIVGGFVFSTKLSGLQPLATIARTPTPFAPFEQQGAEAVATSAQLRVNGKDVPVIVPPVGISGGPAAVFSPFGSYSR